MSVIGKQLLQPEKGWIRIDSADKSISYEGPWIHTSHGSCYNGTRTHTSGAWGCKIKFSFKGTGLRIIGIPDTGSLNIRVSVDGISDGFIPILCYSGTIWQTVMYEKKGFANKMHQCVIDYNCPWAQFDAVDVRESKESFLYLKDNAVYGIKAVD